MLDASTKTLTIGRAEDTTFRFRVKATPGGQAATIDPTQFKFYVQGKAELTRTAQADPGDATVLFFEFDEAYAAALGSKPRAFQIIRTSNSKSQDFLSGTIVAGGFAV